MASGRNGFQNLTLLPPSNADLDLGLSLSCINRQLSLPYLPSSLSISHPITDTFSPNFLRHLLRLSLFCFPPAPLCDGFGVLLCYFYALISTRTVSVQIVGFLSKDKKGLNIFIVSFGERFVHSLVLL